MKRNVTMIDDLPELEDEKDSSMMRGIRPTLSAHQMQNPQMMPPQMRIIPQQQSTLVRMPVPVFDEEPPRSMGFVSDVRNKIEDEKRRIYYLFYLLNRLNKLIRLKNALFMVVPNF